MTTSLLRNILGAGLLLCAGLWQTAGAQTATPTISPAYSGSYALLDLGAPPGVTGSRGGLTLLAGDPNTLLVGGNANGPFGKIFSIGLMRDADSHIIGFDGSATEFATAPEIDGGLAYGPGGVLFYTGYKENLLGQIKPGSTAPDKVVELGPLGVDTSVGTLGFVPAGFPGAGEIRLMSWNTSRLFSASLMPDGNGTYDVGNIVELTTLPGTGPEGMVYVPPGSDLFPDPTMIVSEYNNNEIAAYDLDATGVPIFATRRTFVSGLIGAEGGFIDPLSGDFIFSTFGSANQIIVVGGFLAAVPEPPQWLLMVSGLMGLALYARRGTTGFRIFRAVRLRRER